MPVACHRQGFRLSLQRNCIWTAAPACGTGIHETPVLRSCGSVSNCQNDKHASHRKRIYRYLRWILTVLSLIWVAKKGLELLDAFSFVNFE